MMEHKCIKEPKAGLIIMSPPNTYNNSLITSTCSECQLSLRINKNHESVTSPYRFKSRISKQIASVDEQYLSHCLELIQISAAKATSFNFSVTWSPSKTNSFPKSSFPSPFDVSIFSLKRWNISSETRSKSMILRSPLLIQGKTNNDNNSEVFSFPSVHISPVRFSLFSSPMIEMESGKRKNGSDDELRKERSQYTPRMTSTSSDRSSCTWPIISHGILQCTRRNGINHFVFSMDNKREEYMTKVSKSALSDGSSTILAYFIYSSTSNHRKEHKARKSESYLVGRINVSTRYKFSSDGSKFMETEFVLFGDNECEEEELDKSNSSSDTGNHRRLPSKVSTFFKPLQLPKHQHNTNKWGTSSSLDLSLLTPETEENCDNDQRGRPNLLESDIPSNFELAAIVVKEQVEVVQHETEAGGWGLNFLKSATGKQATKCLQDCQNSVKRSMDVIIPEGFHGGPKTGKTRPSRLIERSENGGQCDCGGWDTGCPLTLLSSRTDSEGWNQKTSLHLFPKGDPGRAPSVKMVNIQNSLYRIDFQSPLSALQCLSIAVAVVHCGCTTLIPNAQTS